MDRHQVPLYVEASGVRPDAGGRVGLSPTDAGSRHDFVIAVFMLKNLRARERRSCSEHECQNGPGCESHLHKSPYDFELRQPAHTISAAAYASAYLPFRRNILFLSSRTTL